MCVYIYMYIIVLNPPKFKDCFIFQTLWVSPHWNHATVSTPLQVVPSTTLPTPLHDVPLGVVKKEASVVTWRIIPVTKLWSIYGDRCCPLRIGLWDPFQMGISWLINGGDPNHLLAGMILQWSFLFDYKDFRITAHTHTHTPEVHYFSWHGLWLWLFTANKNYILLTTPISDDGRFKQIEYTVYIWYVSAPRKSGKVSDPRSPSLKMWWLEFWVGNACQCYIHQQQN